jgi:hypothetical protein
MAQRFEYARVSELNLQGTERRFAGKVAPRNMSVSALLCQQARGTRSSIAFNMKACHLSSLLRPAREHLSELVFAMSCLFVMAVSVHDAMLVVLNADVILEFERNPVGRWLIELQCGDIWLFVLTKLLGTVIVCSILVMLYEFRVRHGLLAAGGVASFQLILLCYLTFGSV